MYKANKRSVLGRGLDSLINTEPAGASFISEIAIERIKPNPDQPRQAFDEDSLSELAVSIKNIGIVQPITVRQEGEEYMIISGERRWRASQIAGLKTVPAYIRTADDDNVMEMALVENIQREDLNAIEIALAYQKLIEVYKMTQEELGKRVGKKRTTISNYLRMLRLPAEVQLGLTQRAVDMGHARTLLQINDPVQQIAVYQRILAEGLSVRAIEEIARKLSDPMSAESEKQPSDKKPSKPGDAGYEALSEHLSKVFSAPVELKCNTQGKGKLSISFASEEELERIMCLLERIQEPGS